MKIVPEQFVKYDIVVDSGVLSPAESAQQIIEKLNQ